MVFAQWHLIQSCELVLLKISRVKLPLNRWAKLVYSSCKNTKALHLFTMHHRLNAKRFYLLLYSTTYTNYKNHITFTPWYSLLHISPKTEQQCYLTHYCHNKCRNTGMHVTYSKKTQNISPDEIIATFKYMYNLSKIFIFTLSRRTRLHKF